MKVTKEQICHKAVDMFRENGFDAVSVESICVECGVTRGSFYHHFMSKNDLLLFWFDDYAKEMISFDMGSASSAKERLRMFLEAYASGISSLGHELLCQTMMADFSMGRGLFIPIPPGASPPEMNTVLSLIMEAQAEGGVTSDISARRLLTAHICAVAGLILQWKLSEAGFDFMDEMRSLFETVFRQ